MGIKVREFLHRISKSTSSSINGSDGSSIFSTSSASPPITLGPGDLTTYAPGHKVSPLEVRELHDLIRRRYALDVSIWGKQNCVPRNRPKVEEDMRRADAVLLRIMSLVQAWDNPQAWKSEADWQRLRAIKQKLEMDGKREWANHPPWEG
jgi:hypothetical protein